MRRRLRRQGARNEESPHAGVTIRRTNYCPTAPGAAGEPTEELPQPWLSAPTSKLGPRSRTMMVVGDLGRAGEGEHLAWWSLAAQQYRIDERANAAHSTL